MASFTAELQQLLCLWSLRKEASHHSLHCVPLLLTGCGERGQLGQTPVNKQEQSQSNQGTGSSDDHAPWKVSDLSPLKELAQILNFQPPVCCCFLMIKIGSQCNKLRSRTGSGEGLLKDKKSGLLIIILLLKSLGAAHKKN
jgi:hypothetical protein